MTSFCRDLVFKASSESVPRIRDLVGEIMAESGFSHRKILEMQLAVEEACTNIVMYAYSCPPSSPDQSSPSFPSFSSSSSPQYSLIHFSAQVTEDALTVELEDWGEPFDPLSHCTAPPSGELESRPEGGLGIYLIKKMTDGAKYQRLEGKNVLQLTKVRRH